MVKILLGILSCMGLWYLMVFFKDYKEAKINNRLEKENKVALSGIGFIICFFDTLGIGGFAPMTAIFKQFKLVNDRIIPGTLNAAMTIPIVIEALIFIKDVKVDLITLVSMLVAATLGALLGAGYVSKLDEKKVQLYMGIALIIVAAIMLAGKLGILPSGGDAVGLSGVKLVIAVIGNFVLGALMTLGIGLYAPCMALVYALGLSPLVAFPIMMGSCAYLMPAATAKFIREGAYHREATLWSTIFGSIGVVVAAYLVKSLPINILTWVVMGVVLYTSLNLLKDAFSSKSQDPLKV
ncbi:MULTISPECIES: sulfite exporter TauE/SafE family protein [Psychrilyobacter]|uniref:Probable membrane transporter protein n=1 Tax=Psychrilyobacter piezotolerans TaxID=2293438 RepID=A0ABX9KEC7_9FUSO|nr:sulfite exporter TauE/SafE family protein [Psychrilyobacter piezotolerans]RDE59527.1 sulfite exporter TauE/SafE family protein [Psychrilyobacter sp. S5]REI39967.1 sulfite exporter TauE/SafE family protein [Psychrilyobacter piezotolerans]